MAFPSSCDPDLLGHEALQRVQDDGCLLLRGAIPGAWVEQLRTAFEVNERASQDWPAPRGPDWRHALVDLEPVVQETCRLPILLSTVWSMLGRPFFLVQVEGREPRRGGGAQILHRDSLDDEAGVTVSALAFLDPFDASNGATRVAPGTHRGAGGAARGRESSATTTLAGDAGDIFVFDTNVLHGGTTNLSGRPRRSLLITFAVTELRPHFDATRALRWVRMDTAEVFVAKT